MNRRAETLTEAVIKTLALVPKEKPQKSIVARSYKKWRKY
jgi:hypothetical protein